MCARVHECVCVVCCSFIKRNGTFIFCFIFTFSNFFHLISEEVFSPRRTLLQSCVCVRPFVSYTFFSFVSLPDTESSNNEGPPLEGKEF